MTIITAFDPGYVQCGIAQVQVYEDGIFVEHVGVIKPAWAAPAMSLEKVDAMIAGLEEYREKYPQFFEADYLVVEAQESYPKRKGRPGTNANVLIRLGKVAGGLYTMVKAETKLFVLPKVWTGSRSKEQNHPKIFARLGNPDPAKWPWVTKITPSQWEHGVDAVGLALWMYDKEQTKGVKK